MPVRILQEDEYGNRVVELSSAVSAGWCSPPHYQQVVAAFDDDAVGLYKVGDADESQQLVLSTEEMDRLIEAYQGYRRDRAVRLQPQESAFVALDPLDEHPF